jgi:hypothetical protein
MKPLTQRPRIISLKKNFFDIECLTTILQKKRFSFSELLKTSVISSLTTNYNFPEALGLSVYILNWKEEFWVIFQDLYITVKKKNSCPSYRFTINNCCKNKSETRCQTKLCELTVTFTYSWVPDCFPHKLPLSHPYCAITRHTDCHCYVRVPDLLHVLIVWPSSCSTWVKYLEFSHEQSSCRCA